MAYTQPSNTCFDIQSTSIGQVSAFTSGRTQVLSRRCPLDPMVSVCLITYNHEKFVAQAIDGVLMQETDFTVELVIGEDCSTDGTRQIVIDYQQRFPDRIQVLLSTENLGKYTGNGRLNFIRNLKACHGKYIALLDGDDYWTDPNKLQKQVDFLDGNPAYVACFTQAEQRIEDLQDDRRTLIPSGISKTDYYFSDFLESNPFATVTCVFRREALTILPWFIELPFGDLGIYLFLAYPDNKAKYIPEVTAVYRVHTGGIHGSVHYRPSYEKYCAAYQQHIKFYKKIRENMHLNEEHLEQITRTIADRNERILDLAFQNRAFKPSFLVLKNLVQENFSTAAILMRRVLRRAVKRSGQNFIIWMSRLKN